MIHNIVTGLTTTMMRRIQDERLGLGQAPGSTTMRLRAEHRAPGSTKLSLTWAQSLKMGPCQALDLSSGSRINGNDGLGRNVGTACPRHSVFFPLPVWWGCTTMMMRSFQDRRSGLAWGLLDGGSWVDRNKALDPGIWHDPGF